MATILVIDDERDMLDVLAYNLERAGHRVVTAGSAEEALERLERGTPDLIVSDIMMPGLDGLQLCARVRSRPETARTPFVFVTAKGQTEDKYAGLVAGADDYIEKPFELDDLIARVNGRLERQARAVEDVPAPQADERPPVPPPVAPQPTPADGEAIRERVRRFEERFPALAGIRRTRLVGEHPAFLAVFEEVLVAAAGDEPTLILGATGTGKTGVAEAVHALGDRAGRPFLVLNCSELAAGDPSIALGKLFGIGRSSGLPNVPKEGRPGLLEEADGGVLFLDEVAVLPERARSALLFPLEGRPFRPAVGAGRARTVDVKFVFATNRDLNAEVAQGAFPRDLYERIAVAVVRLPCLEEREGDVPLLAGHLLREVAGEEASFAADALARLRAHRWPGNVRELRNAVRYAWRRARLDERGTIAAGDLPAQVGATAADPASPPAGAALPADLTAREQAELLALRAAGFRVGEAEAALGYSSRSRTLSHRLRGLCFKALGLSGFDVERAAVLLGGEDPELAGPMKRRLRTLLDGLAARLDEPDARHERHLLAEHRPWAKRALEHVRGRGRQPGV